MCVWSWFILEVEVVLELPESNMNNWKVSVEYRQRAIETRTAFAIEPKYLSNIPSLLKLVQSFLNAVAICNGGW